MFDVADSDAVQHLRLRRLAVLCVAGLLVSACQEDLEQIDGGGSRARAINDNGIIVGGAKDASGVFRVVSWGPDLKVTNLGFGAPWVSAIDVANDGSIVVTDGSGLMDTDRYALRWGADGVLTEVQGHVAALSDNGRLAVGSREGIAWKWRVGDFVGEPITDSGNQTFGIGVDVSDDGSLLSNIPVTATTSRAVALFADGSEGVARGWGMSFDDAGRMLVRTEDNDFIIVNPRSQTTSTVFSSRSIRRDGAFNPSRLNRQGLVVGTWQSMGQPWRAAVLDLDTGSIRRLSDPTMPDYPVPTDVNASGVAVGQRATLADSFAVLWSVDDPSIFEQGVANWSGPKRPNVSPIVECAIDNGDGTRTALFGYENLETIEFSVPVGSLNSLKGASVQPPTLFTLPMRYVGRPGRTNMAKGVFKVTFRKGEKIVWSLAGRTATASSQTKLC
jgi:hypothetical protein